MSISSTEKSTRIWFWESSCTRPPLDATHDGHPPPHSIPAYERPLCVPPGAAAFHRTPGQTAFTGREGGWGDGTGPVCRSSLTSLFQSHRWRVGAGRHSQSVPFGPVREARQRDRGRLTWKLRNSSCSQPSATPTDQPQQHHVFLSRGAGAGGVPHSKKPGL